MSGKLSHRITLLLLAALGALLAVPAEGHPWAHLTFWVLALLLVANLAWYVRRQRRQARLASRQAAGSLHFMVDTLCHLNWERLSGGFDEATSRLLKGLVNRGPQDGRALRPSLEKAVSGLKRLIRRHPEDPGPPAYCCWCLALLSRITGKELAEDLGGEAPESRLWNAGSEMHHQAARLAPDQGHILADWARILEDQAEVLAATEGAPGCFLEQALKNYAEAVDLDPELAAAWRGRGRTLAKLALIGTEPSPDLLAQAVGFFETARRDRDWGGDFYGEFGQVVCHLAEHHETQGGHYFRYAARLFVLAAEKNEGDGGLIFQAGRALHQAGLLAEDDSPEEAVGLYRQALEYFKEAAGLEADEPEPRLWAARCLAALYHQAETRRRVRPHLDQDPDPASLALLEEASELCAQAAGLAPGEEIFSEWAHLLSLRAEHGGARAGDLWADTARKYSAAVAFPRVPDERAAINWHNWGYALACLAETRPSAARRRKLLREAARKYEQAARLNGDNLVTLKNWGDVLGDLADLTDDPVEADRLAAEAVEKFRRAAELYPDQAGPWRRWSAILQGRARVESDPDRRRELWREAQTRLEEGVKAAPDDPATWVLWGQVLSEVYWEASEYERPRLVAPIIDKYEKALALDPRDDEAWNLLGRVRLEASELPEELVAGGGDPLGQAVAAGEHLKIACALNPQFSGHWAEWGRALFRLAQIVDNEASGLAALKDAHEKYETAVALSPGEGEHHTGLGHVLYQWGWRLEEPESKRAKFKEAYRHCAEAGRLAPHDPTVWRNWAKVTEALATVEKDPQKSFDWQNEATEKYYHADTLEPPLTRTRRH